MRWIQHQLDDPLPDDALGGALLACAGFLERLMRPELFLRAVRAALDGGACAFLLATVDRDLVEGAEHQGPPADPTRVREWNEEELRRFLADEGLEAWFGRTRATDRDDVPVGILVAVPGRSRDARRALEVWLAGRRSSDALVEEQANELAELRGWAADLMKANAWLRGKLETQYRVIARERRSSIRRATACVLLERRARRLNETTCVVFSRDRPMQLDALLRSIRKYAPGVLGDLSVVYKATADAFQMGYERLMSEWAGVVWRPEGTFRSDVRGSVGSRPLTVFHTDDDIYFGRVPRFSIDDEVVCFSLRLGLNVTYSYTLDRDEYVVEPLLGRASMTWRWREQPLGTFRYPLALNGHVFRTDDVEAWLAGVEFGNPNELEHALQQFLDKVPPKMRAFLRSKVVSIPANIVNETTPNRHGGQYSVGELNERFLAGD